MRGEGSVLRLTLHFLYTNNVPANFWVDVELSAENISLLSRNVNVDRALLKLERTLGDMQNQNQREASISQFQKLATVC
jgi:hypothetical protein